MKTGILRLTFSIVTTLCLLAPIAQPALGGTLHHQTKTGTTIYVGGNGPGNYTHIQEALNAATDFDTVYVYHDRSPYHEIIHIDHSLTLQGENKATTSIDGTGYNGDIITINAPHVLVQGFTIEHTNRNGITTSHDDTTILQTIITDCASTGILLTTTTAINGCALEINTITDCTNGITIQRADTTWIRGNELLRNHIGITTNTSFHTTITYNLLDKNSIGIIDQNSATNNISHNQISNSTTGLLLISSMKNTITDNNFDNNPTHATFTRKPITELRTILTARLTHDTLILDNYHLLGRTTWKGNYWNNTRTLPYPIPGRSTLLFQTTRMNRVEFDYAPAQQPNDNEYKISTKVNPITPFEQTSSHLALTISAPSDLDNVTVYYRYQPTNFTQHLTSFQEAGFGFTGLDYPDTVDVVNGIAYVASRLNSRIVCYDVTNATKPQLLWYTQNTTYLYRVNDIKVTRDRHYCYTISMTKKWVVMWDVSTNIAAIPVAEYQISDTGYGMYLAISTDNNYLYVTSYHKLFMFNITNKIGHQLQMIYNDFVPGDNTVLWKPTIYQDTVYVPNGAKTVEESGLYVYDVSNKAAPYRANIINQSTTCSAACQVYTHSNGFTYLFLGGRSQITPYSVGILNIYNISAGNTTHPVFLYSIRVLDNDTGGHGGNATSGWGVFLHDYLFMGINNWNHTIRPDYQTGFWVWNFTNLMEPTVAGRMYGAASPYYLNYVHYLDLDQNGSDRTVYLAIQDDDCIIAVAPNWAETQGGWVKYQSLTQEPWSVNFTFTNGTGYYEFYSIGKKTGLTPEAPPFMKDTICHYIASQAPSDSIDNGYQTSDSSPPLSQPTLPGQST